jgi:hypothetical protein
MNQAIITTANAARWTKALDRAISNALDVYICSATGEAFVESASTPGTLYSVSREHCTCPAGMKNQICQHRAAYLCQAGELPLSPEPSRVAFTGSGDRVEVLVDGEVFGFAVANEHGGWNTFRGSFPTATRFRSADGCTLDEVQRQLMAQLPNTLHIPAATAAADLVAAA